MFAASWLNTMWGWGRCCRLSYSLGCWHSVAECLVSVQPLSLIQLSANTHPGRQRTWVPVTPGGDLSGVLGSCTGLVQPQLLHAFKDLGSEPSEWKMFLFLPFSLFCSAFRINKNKHCLNVKIEEKQDILNLHKWN